MVPSGENEYESEEAGDNPTQPSGFERIKHEGKFKELTDLLSKIQEAFQSSLAAAAASTTTSSNNGGNNNTSDPNTAATTTTTNGNNNNTHTTTSEITISNLENGNTSNGTGNNTSAHSDTNVATNSNNIGQRNQVEMLREDVDYIKKNIDSLNSSPDSSRVEDLLQDLMDAAVRSEEDFKLGSQNLKNLLNTVAKLKVRIPRQQASNVESLETAKEKKKKKESPYTSSKQKENAAAGIVKKLVSLKMPEWDMAGLLRSYEDLTVKSKLCLLCFSVFPCDVEKKKGVLIQKSLEIKKKILIYWWVGEGFIDLDCEEEVAPADANSTKYPDPKLNLVQNTKQIPRPANPNTSPSLNPIQDQIIEENPNPNSSPNTSPSSNAIQDQIIEENSNPNSSPSINPNGNLNPNPGSDLNLEENPNPNPSANTPETQVSLAQSRKKKTIEEIGEQILKVLTQKGFIEPVMQKGRESGSCRMHPFVHSFVTALAKRAGFFDFSKENGKLIPRFTHSQRACLVKKSQDNIPSSCELWAKYTESRDKLKRFETVQTLFNVNESIIDIRPEWFSKMKYLSVLHLGSWHSGTAEHIEVEDQKFFEDLKNMNQLKLFSLQGVSTIMNLPDSICKLSNLIILDLRECHNLEELPADIGLLKNLTHLDITECHLLTKLPKGISLLSNLEVLRGFVINDQAGDPQDKKVCILNHWWKKTKRCVIHDLFHCKNKEICTLRDLLKLEKLRELSIVVNNENFPNAQELKVFKEMENLQKLKISWERSSKDENKTDSNAESATNQGENNAPEEEHGDNKAPEENQGDNRAPEGNHGDNKAPEENQGDNRAPEENHGDNKAPEGNHGDNKAPEENHGDNKAPEESSVEVEPKAPKATDQKASTTNECPGLMKCCKRQSNQKDIKKKSKRENLDQIRKLELWCFPLETATWLVPEELKNLEKLYIKGGKLADLPEGTNGNKWKVTTLRLKYLRDLVITWTDLKDRFPKMTYLEKHECNKLGLFPSRIQSHGRIAGFSISLVPNAILLLAIIVFSCSANTSISTFLSSLLATINVATTRSGIYDGGDGGGDGGTAALQ